MQLVVFRNNLASNNNSWTRPTQQARRLDSELSPEEQRESIKMLKKEIYNPIPKKIIQRLEEFEPKEVVMGTPCNHRFHEDCISPWVKSHGGCPVCRFSFTTKDRESGASSTNNDNLVNNQLTNEMIPFVTSRGNSGTTIIPSGFESMVI
ncbi:zinc finger, RING/FYVE/PHD-type [Artemisia annua]|uniref:Zinc finger, RING/FYVE/PHD-type n=1 Tax=Artemisia annua TaxID=35608 RepID=A0A2U1M819_ARTAN|nr:zinc finger, RING/FYVE/PHD-type [Artemisia annua]